MTADDTVQALAELIERELRMKPAISYTPENPGVIGTYGGMTAGQLARAVLDSGLVAPAAPVDGEDDLRQQVSRAVASAWYNISDPTVTDAVMAVVRPLLAERDAAVERAGQAENHIKTVETERDALRGVSDHLQTVGEDLVQTRRRADRAEADLAAAEKRLDQIRALADNLEAAEYGPAIVNKLRAILDAAPADETGGASDG